MLRWPLLFALLACACSSAGNAQAERRLEIRTFGPLPESVSVQAPKADSAIPLNRQGNLFYGNVQAGTEYRIHLRYKEDTSHHLAPGWDIVQIRYLIPPGQTPFFREVQREYPVSCNRPELNRLNASTTEQAWGNALRGRLMLLQQQKDSCFNILGEVQAAYLKLCRRVTGLDRYFRGLK